MSGQKSVEVLTPLELRDQIKDEIQKMAGLYSK